MPSEFKSSLRVLKIFDKRAMFNIFLI
ncbi:hypothetical protein CBM2615_B80078 [Cupriavidus taiwanensis]|uniref:Uncharacterized protein n=1 Tax=Cupriavidus taiwanensis TaxID=164546 RepID=A0A976B3U5_9BURK|nr:hypothetical protein CBM2614_B80077 [Cupriavidus taiwanensis]SOZ71075.1 hypothetical protein CBM2615_B80078 [Cupriavidus taiwanensis]SOZ73736.1 hypothetical protein CBM2613_B60078 [Cupriavidus taiwanensis]SPA10547.1 hypothetical protein CBM2625_B70076 [Cupriavidus taiwanensis]